MRRRAPWLRYGKPTGKPEVLRRLTTPALGSAAIPTAIALNVQGMVVLIGIALGPAAAAVFSTLRTMTRVVIQLVGSISAVIAPELARAYGAGNRELLHVINRRGAQAAVWLSAPILVALALFGGPIVDLWTQGTVHVEEPLLYLLLLVAGISSLWYTSFTILFATNRHQRVAFFYLIACLIALLVAYVLLEAIGLDGGGVALVLLELSMLGAVLRRSLPAAHDTLGAWLLALAEPPLTPRKLAGLRSELRGSSP
jgi:O-antigen/teichoic acid export membrane protein